VSESSELFVANMSVEFRQCLWILAVLPYVPWRPWVGVLSIHAKIY
jgi:hypothetical protein